MKVVINKCYGGFAISLEAARFMAARGNKRAQAEVAEYDAKVADKSKQSELERKYGVSFYGMGYVAGMDGEYDRTDPDLVAAVEELGADADGNYSSLAVADVPDGIEFYISEYDGMERVAEQHRTWG